MVVTRVQLDKQTAEAYALGFQKIFDYCFRSSTMFEVDKTRPLGVVID